MPTQHTTRNTHMMKKLLVPRKAKTFLHFEISILSKCPNEEHLKGTRTSGNSRSKVCSVEIKLNFLS